MHVLKFKQNNCRPWLYHLHHHWRPWTIIQWIINSSLKLIGRSNQSTVPTHLHPNISGGFDHTLEELKRLQLQVCVMVQMIFNPSGYCKFEDEFFQTGTMMQIWHWHWVLEGCGIGVELLPLVFSTINHSFSSDMFSIPREVVFEKLKYNFQWTWYALHCIFLERDRRICSAASWWRVLLIFN